MMISGWATHSLAIRIVHISVTLLDQLFGECLNLVKVVRGVDDLVVGDFNHCEVFFDCLLKLVLQVISCSSRQPSSVTDILFERVGIVKPQDELTLVLIR